MIADEILKNVEFDVIRMVYNKFSSVVSFQPSIATILSPEVRVIYSDHFHSIMESAFALK